jgi:hypothetical protein
MEPERQVGLEHVCPPTQWAPAPGESDAGSINPSRHSVGFAKEG